MKTSRTSAPSAAGAVTAAQQTQSPFRTGQILTGTVISELAPRWFYVDFGHTASTAKSNLRLKPGNRIRVRVAGTRGQVTLKLLGDDNQEMGLEEQLEALLTNLALPVTPAMMEIAWTLARLGLRPEKERIEYIAGFLKDTGADSLYETELAVWLFKTKDKISVTDFNSLKTLCRMEPGSWTKHIPVITQSIKQIQKKTHTQKVFNGLLRLALLFPKDGSIQETAKQLISLALDDAQKGPQNNLCAQLTTEIKLTVDTLRKQQHTDTQEKVLLEAGSKMLEGLRADELISGISLASHQGSLAAFPFLSNGRQGRMITRTLEAGSHKWMSFACILPSATRINAYLNIDRGSAQVNFFSSDEEIVDFAKDNSDIVRKILKTKGIDDLEINCSRTQDESQTLQPPALPELGKQRLDIIA